MMNQNGRDNFPSAICYICEKKMHSSSFRAHSKSKKHQKLMKEAQSLANCWIEVTGAPSMHVNEPLIRSIFQSHGKILKIVFQNGAFYIRFLKAKAAFFSLEKRHIMCKSRTNDVNINLWVKPVVILAQEPLGVDVFQVDPENNQMDDFRHILSHTICSIKSRLQESAHSFTFENIATEIVSSVLSLAQNEQSTQQVYGELNRMFQPWKVDLQRNLRLTHVDIRVYVFGSVEIGLALSRYSDIDIYLYVANSFLDLLHETTNLLWQNSDRFHDILTIKGARVPIVKAVHTETDIPLDISFKSKLGWFNTQLIKFYVKYDTRVKILLALVKIWFKKNDLNDNRAFTSYSIYWMTLFYLQQLSPPLIPSVHQLLQFYPSTLCLGWEVVNSEELQCLNKAYPPSNNTMCLEELVLGFFRFYQDLDLRDSVVCPLLGKILPRRVFEPENLDQLPPEMDRYCKYVQECPKDTLRLSSQVCIQDPYDLSHNICKAVTHATLSLLQHHISTVWVLQRMSPAHLLIHLLEDRNAERDFRLQKFDAENENLRLERLLAACEQRKRARELKLKTDVSEKVDSNEKKDSNIEKDEVSESRNNVKKSNKRQEDDSRREVDSPRKEAKGTSPTEAVSKASFLKARKSLVIHNSKRTSAANRETHVSTVHPENAENSKDKEGNNSPGNSSRPVQPQCENPKLVQPQCENPKLVQSESESPKFVQPQSGTPNVLEPQSGNNKLVQPQSGNNKLVQLQSGNNKLVQPQSGNNKVVPLPIDQPFNISSINKLFEQAGRRNSALPESVLNSTTQTASVDSICKQFDKTNIQQIDASTSNSGSQQQDGIRSNSQPHLRPTPASTTDSGTSNPFLQMFTNLASAAPPTSSPVSSPPRPGPPGLQPFSGIFPVVPSASPMLPVYHPFPVNHVFPVNQVFSVNHPFPVNPNSPFPVIPPFPITPSSLMSSSPQSQSSSSSNSVAETLKVLAFHSPQHKLSPGDLQKNNVSNIESQLLGSITHVNNNRISIENLFQSNASPKENQDKNVKANDQMTKTATVNHLDIDKRLQNLKQMIGNHKQQIGITPLKTQSSPGDVTKFIDVSTLEMNLRPPQDSTAQSSDTLDQLKKPNDSHNDVDVRDRLKNDSASEKNASENTKDKNIKNYSNKRNMTGHSQKTDYPRNSSISSKNSSYSSENSVNIPKNITSSSDETPTRSLAGKKHIDYQTTNSNTSIKNSVKSNHIDTNQEMVNGISKPHSSVINDHSSSRKQGPVNNLKEVIAQHKSQPIKPTTLKQTLCTYYIQPNPRDKRSCSQILILPSARVDLCLFYDIVNQVLIDYLEQVCHIELHSNKYLNATEFVLRGKHRLDVCQKRNKLLKEAGFDPPRALNHSKFEVEILKSNFLLTHARQDILENRFLVSVHSRLVERTGDNQVHVNFYNENSKSDTNQYVNFLTYVKNAFVIINKEITSRYLSH